MKTAHEVLQEEQTARLEREAGERKWAELARRWRTRAPWRARFWSSLTGLGMVLVLLLRPSLHGDVLSICILSAGLLLFCVIWYAADQQRKKEMALLAIIEQEAPQLFQKLKDEKIA